MRLRNVKNKEEIMRESDSLIVNPTNYKGKWKEYFNNDNPIYVEIGMGKGKFIVENALNNPDINYIGIEKYDSVVAKALQKIDKKLDNLVMVRADANIIQDIFDHEVTCIYLNFSDPWPKARHTDRRLTSKRFLARYDNLFSGNKHIIFKTDNRKLFEFSIMSLTEYGYRIENISLDLYNDDIKDNVATEYEEKFHNKGMPIYKIEVSKEK